MFAVYLMAIFNGQLFLRLPCEQLLWKVHALYLGCLLLFIYGYFLTVMMTKRSSAKILLIPVVFYLLLFFYPPIMANLNHGQPLVYGYLAGRNFITILSGLLIFLLLRNRVISIDDLVITFLAVAWTSLIYFFLLTRIVDESAHVDEMSNVGVSTHLGVRYVFNISFIVYGCIYYFQAMLTRLGVWNVASFISYFSYLVFIYKGRTTLAVVLFLLVLIMLRGLKSRVKRIFGNTILVLVLLITGAFCGLALYGDSSFLEGFEESFNSAWLALNGELGDDPSANSRIYQTEIITKYWSGGVWRLLLGTGQLSRQYNDGFIGTFGYLYPSDTGLIGGTFVFGLLGIVLVTIVVLMALKWANKVVKVCNDDGILSIRYYYFYYLIMSLSTIEILFRSYHVVMMYGIFAYLYSELFIKKRSASQVCTNPISHHC